METEAAEFLPPRLVTPPSSDVAIYVCDSRDDGDFKQAWAFQVTAHLLLTRVRNTVSSFFALSHRSGTHLSMRNE